MTVMVVGSKLVRAIGSNYAITESIGNKTFTRVVNKDGEIIANRIKEITKHNVGDKFVITKKTDDVQRDLVYDKNGKFLGMRLLGWFYKGKPTNILKVNSDYVGKWKYVDIDDINAGYDRVVKYSQHGQLKQGRKITNFCETPDGLSCLFKEDSVITRHNKFGLPIPNVRTTSGDCDKNYFYMHLRDMIGKDTNAFYKGSGFEHLNYVKPKFDVMEYVKNLTW